VSSSTHFNINQSENYQGTFSQLKSTGGMLRDQSKKREFGPW